MISGLTRCWKAVHDFMAHQPPKYEQLCGLGTYSLYAGNYDTPEDDGTHMYLRLVNPEGLVECDVKSTRKKSAGSSYLQAGIDTKAAGVKKGDHDILLWQGHAAEACTKMHAIAMLVEKVNQAWHPYHPSYRSGNTLFRAALDTVGVILPNPLQRCGWTPGIEWTLEKDVGWVKAKMEKQKSGNTFASLSRALAFDDLMAGPAA